MSDSTINRGTKNIAHRRYKKLWPRKAHVIIFESILIGAAIIEGIKFLWFLIQR
jgi:hypothetical protein